MEKVLEGAESRYIFAKNMFISVLLQELEKTSIVTAGAQKVSEENKQLFELCLSCFRWASYDSIFAGMILKRVLLDKPMS